MFVDIFYNLPKGILKAIKLSTYIGKYHLDEESGGPKNSEKQWWDANIIDNVIPVLASCFVLSAGFAFIANECVKKQQAYIAGGVAIFFLILSIIGAIGKKD